MSTGNGAIRGLTDEEREEFWKNDGAKPISDDELAKIKERYQKAINELWRGLENEPRD